MRGLKSSPLVPVVCVLTVAPYTGAWIEIVRILRTLFEKVVAPYTGAWIEIFNVTNITYDLITSHPTRVRGLKLYYYDHVDYHICRTLHGCVD